MNELYQILKVKPKASPEEIHRSFRRLAKETHPDLNGNDDKKVKRFKEIKEAYDILSDPEKRAHYDVAQVKPDAAHSVGSSFGADIRDYVLGLLNRQIRLKRRRLCTFFVACVLALLMGFMVWMRDTLELRRILSMVRISSLKEALIIFGFLLGFVLVVLLIDTMMIIRIHFKLKHILKRKG